MAMAVPLSPQPQSPEGFYAINNQFLTDGPKGFSEFTMLENADLFVRMDLPGVPEEGVSVSLERSKKAVVVYAEAPKVHQHDSTDRQYVTMTGLVCRCCEISSVTTHMSDGVLRLVLSKTPISPQRPSCISFLRGRGLAKDLRGSGTGPRSSGTGPYTQRFPHGRIGTDPNDPALTGPVLQPNPWVIPMSVMAYESKQLQNGKLYVRVDMPGVPKENFTVSVTNGRVKVTGEAPAVGDDSDGRFYSGDVAMLSAPVDIPSRRIKTIAKNGVIRLLIPPV